MVLKWKPKCFSSPLATVIVDTGGHFCRTEDGRTVINKLKYDKNYQEILQRNTRLTLSHDKYKQYPFNKYFGITLVRKIKIPQLSFDSFFIEVRRSQVT